jgi:hypothetical protein
MGTHNFCNSNRDFYSENNNVSQVHIHLHTYQKYKKKVKNATIVYTPFCANHWPHICAIPCYCLSFVFPANLIWLLHCNAMHFDSFSLGVRHLFQKLVLFFFL